MLAILPPELANIVTQNLGKADLTSARLVCREWHDLTLEIFGGLCSPLHIHLYPEWLQPFLSLCNTSRLAHFITKAFIYLRYDMSNLEFDFSADDGGAINRYYDILSAAKLLKDLFRGPLSNCTSINIDLHELYEEYLDPTSLVCYEQPTEAKLSEDINSYLSFVNLCFLDDFGPPITRLLLYLKFKESSYSIELVMERSGIDPKDEKDNTLKGLESLSFDLTTTTYQLEYVPTFGLNQWCSKVISHSPNLRQVVERRIKHWPTQRAITHVTNQRISCYHQFTFLYSECALVADEFASHVPSTIHNIEILRSRITEFNDIQKILSFLKTCQSLTSIRIERVGVAPKSMGRMCWGRDPILFYKRTDRPTDELENVALEYTEQVNLEPSWSQRVLKDLPGLASTDPSLYHGISYEGNQMSNALDLILTSMTQLERRRGDMLTYVHQ